MIYFKVNKNEFILYNEERKRARVVLKDEIEEKLANIDEQLAELPEPVTNTQKIAWFDENYPNSDEIAQRGELEERKQEILLIVNELKKL